MGIRIHKVMGYGLVDVKHNDDDCIVDDRFNPKSFLIDYNQENIYSAKKYLSWLQKRHEKTAVDINSQKTDDNTTVDWFREFDLTWEIGNVEKSEFWKPDDNFTYASEFGLPNVVTVTPLCSLKQWQRYDDDIDYVEETLKLHEDENFEANHVTLCDSPIYPYTSWMDKRTGKILKDYSFEYNRLRLVKCLGKQVNLLPAAKAMGFDSVEECEENMRCAIPGSIRLLCEFCEIFVDEKTINELVPMIYVYWG